jgi:hypothetical protein
MARHSCEYCELSATDLDKEISLRTVLMTEADATAENLGGLRCADADRATVETLESEAAGHEHERYMMRECKRSRQTK